MISERSKHRDFFALVFISKSISKKILIKTDKLYHEKADRNFRKRRKRTIFLIMSFFYMFKDIEVFDLK